MLDASDRQRSYCRTGTSRATMPGRRLRQALAGQLQRDVEIAVGPDDHVVHAAELVEDDFLVRHLVAGDLEPAQLLARRAR